jgi:calcineurin-like phosphoesterase family protein
MYTIFLISSFLIFVMLFLISSNNSVLSADDDDEFFVLPEEQFYDPEDYGGESSLSSDGRNSSSDTFKSHPELVNKSTTEFVDSANSSDFNFALFGDWGCTKNTTKTVKIIQRHDPELVFSLGDTSYGVDIKCWKDIVKPISDRMKAVIGNHDVMSPFLLNQHLKEFGLDKPYYSFDYNSNIHFLMMDSESSYLPGSDPDFSDLKNTEQYQFVKNDLSHASKNPAIKWIIVMSHRQFYSSLCGDHDSCEPIKKLRYLSSSI